MFQEYQKHNQFFSLGVKTLLDFTIKHILNFVEEYQIHCLYFTLPYGNDVTESSVFKFFKEYLMLIVFAGTDETLRRQN